MHKWKGISIKPISLISLTLHFLLKSSNEIFGHLYVKKKHSPIILNGNYLNLWKKKKKMKLKVSNFRFHYDSYLFLHSNSNFNRERINLQLFQKNTWFDYIWLLWLPLSSCFIFLKLIVTSPLVSLQTFIMSLYMKF